MLVDLIDDSMVAAVSAMEPLEFEPEGPTNPLRVLSEWSIDELDCSGGRQDGRDPRCAHLHEAGLGASIRHPSPGSGRYRVSATDVRAKRPTP